MIPGSRLTEAAISPAQWILPMPGTMIWVGLLIGPLTDFDGEKVVGRSMYFSSSQTTIGGRGLLDLYRGKSHPIQCLYPYQQPKRQPSRDPCTHRLRRKPSVEFAQCSLHNHRTWRLSPVTAVAGYRYLSQHCSEWKLRWMTCWSRTGDDSHSRNFVYSSQILCGDC